MYNNNNNNIRQNKEKERRKQRPPGWISRARALELLKFATSFPAKTNKKVAVEVKRKKKRSDSEQVTK